MHSEPTHPTSRPQRAAVAALLLLVAVGTLALVPRGTAVAAPAGRGGTVKDSDGNEYRTVTIGSQEWMVGNLRTTRFNDGTAIPEVKDGPKWMTLLTPAHSWYGNNAGAHKSAYGALYNWPAVATGKLCPKGWRVPTDADWQKLVDGVGGKTVAGGKLKSTAAAAAGGPDISENELEIEQPTYVPDAKGGRAALPGSETRTPALWNRPNTGATNETGFFAVPGGRRTFAQSTEGGFENRGTYGYWWSSTEASQAIAWSRSMTYDNSHVSRMDDHKADGLSVCCVRE